MQWYQFIFLHGHGRLKIMDLASMIKETELSSKALMYLLTTPNYQINFDIE